MLLLLLFNIVFIFPCYLQFSGVHGNASEFIDISDLKDSSNEGTRFARDVFGRSGFADSIEEYKLGPCPLGTFVDSSRTHPSCKHCPAGKL